MNTNNDLLIENLCRTCMQELDDEAVTTSAKANKEQWHIIYDNVREFSEFSIAELLNVVIPKLNVQPRDEISKRICCECLQHLLKSYRFQQMCLQSEQQICMLIAKKATLEQTTTREDDKIRKVFLIEEPMIEESERIGIKAEDTLLLVEEEAITHLNSSSAVADPLKDVDEENERCEEQLERLCAEFIKNEPNYDVINYKPQIKTDRIPISMLECKDEIIATATTIAPTTAPIALTLSEDEKVSSVSSTCTFCNKSFNRRDYLRKHLKRHKKWLDKREAPPKPKKTYEPFHLHCDICNRPFQKAESLQKHRLEHDENAVLNHPCEGCGKAFNSRSNLNKHQRLFCVKNPDKEMSKRYACEICKKRYHTTVTLSEHMRTHTGERPYLCTECGKSFNRIGSFKNHQLRHGNVKRYECPHCPLKFFCISDVSKHKVMHSEIKRHVCDICGDSFGKSNQLKVHKMFHNGEKPYKCDYCDMRMSTARRHMCTHTGEKPYKCKYCTRAFVQSNDMVKHLRIHLGENIYRCELCPATFRLMSELRLHFATHKNDDEETRERNLKAWRKAEAELQLKLAGTLEMKQGQRKREVSPTQGGGVVVAETTADIFVKN